MQTIKDYCSVEIEKLWDEVRRFEYPHAYYVDLSKELLAVKESLLQIYSVYDN